MSIEMRKVIVLICGEAFNSPMRNQLKKKLYYHNILNFTHVEIYNTYMIASHAWMCSARTCGHLIYRAAVVEIDDWDAKIPEVSLYSEACQGVMLT